MSSKKIIKFLGPWPLKKRLAGKIVILIILLGAIVLAADYFYQKNTLTEKNISHNQQQGSDQSYLAFIDEIYDKILENYWEKIADDKLANLYKLAAEKITQQPVEVFFKDKNGVNAMLKQIIKNKNKQEKKDFTSQLANIVLANLEPFGRSGLFGQKQKQELANRVSNVDPTVNLYQVLNVDKNASNEIIKQKYKEENKKLEQTIENKSTNQEEREQAKQKLNLVKRAYETLNSETKRQTYNESGIESSVDSRLITPNIFYIHIKKISPTSFEEFKQAVKSMDTKSIAPNTLILDLRDNIGGSVDLMQWFLGPFIGQGNLAYEFYHQGERQPFKTQTGWLNGLVRYKKTVILVNQNTQSSAEVMSAALKKYNVGILVGVPTKGWGTIEKLYPIKNQISKDETYSMFLVHSLTLCDDNQPIQGKGVEPDINIESADWQQQLNAYFNYPALTTAVKKLWFENQ